MDPEEIPAFRERLRELETRVSRLEAAAGGLDEALARRSLKILRSNPRVRLLLPPTGDADLEEALYGTLRRYSFRLVLRDLIRLRDRFEVTDLLNYASEPTVRNDLRFLLEHGVIEERNGAYSLALPSVDSFGDTLEWFVAQIFTRELSCPAYWGVTLEGMETGGDYDVLALAERHLVQVEVKSSPPKHIEEKEVGAFLERANALRPDWAVFLEDTGLRMSDKIVVLFRDAIRRRYGSQATRRHAITRLKDEVFLVGERVFIVNSAPDIVQNLALCLAHMLRPTPPL